MSNRNTMWSSKYGAMSPSHITFIKTKYDSSDLGQRLLLILLQSLFARLLRTNRNSTILCAQLIRTLNRSLHKTSRNTDPSITFWVNQNWNNWLSGLVQLLSYLVCTIIRSSHLFLFARFPVSSTVFIPQPEDGSSQRVSKKKSGLHLPVWIWITQ